MVGRSVVRFSGGSIFFRSYFFSIFSFVKTTISMLCNLLGSYIDFIHRDDISNCDFRSGMLPSVSRHFL